MGWAVGEDHKRFRHIGYGVPAHCDHPGCTTPIDRGISYACGDGVMGDSAFNCGLFFCGDHLGYAPPEGAEDRGFYCERCSKSLESFEPSPDTEEWITHVLFDESWAEFRTKEPEWTQVYLKRLEGLSPC